jgi:hypothetical protein
MAIHAFLRQNAHFCAKDVSIGIRKKLIITVIESMDYEMESGGGLFAENTQNVPENPFSGSFITEPVSHSPNRACSSGSSPRWQEIQAFARCDLNH